jgi:hypothetical protein
MNQQRKGDRVEIRHRGSFIKAYFLSFYFESTIQLTDLKRGPDQYLSFEKVGLILKG